MSDPTPHARTSNTIARGGVLSLQAIGLYTILASYAGEKRACWPSVATLAKLGNVSVSTLRRTLRELETCGLLETENRAGQSSIYHLKDDITPVKSGRGTPVKSDRGVNSEGGDPGQIRQGTPTKSDRGPRSNLIDEEVLRRSTKEEVGEARGKSDAPGVELSPDGVPRLVPTAYDTEGKPVYSSDSVLEVTKIANHITGTDLDLPLRAWIETHDTKIPRSHDLQQLIRQVSVYGAERVTIGIRRMGDAGQLAMRHLVAWLQENATPIVTAGGAA